MFPVGPISAEAKAVDTWVKDPERVGVVLAALPEELPVTETLELRDELRERGVTVSAAVLNGLLVDRFTDAEAKRAATFAADDALAAAARHAFETVIWEHARCDDQATERERLDAGLDEPASVLPFVFTPQLVRAHVASLARWLTPAGQDVLRAQLAGSVDGPAAAAAAATESAAAGARARKAGRP
jgi:hypothetical protein